MAKYLLTTQSAINECMLFSTRKPEFRTDSLEEARKAFQEEEKALKRDLIREDKLKYTPTDKENEHAICCTLWEVIEDEDGGEPELKEIDESYNYYEK